MNHKLGKFTAIRNAALALIICVSIHTAPIHAVCKSEACKQATAWKNGYTAIVLDDNISRADYFAVLDAVKANKGVVAIEAGRVLLGWIPIAKAAKIRGTRGVSAVLYEAVPHPDVFVHRNDALAALSFFNRVRTGEFEDVIEEGLTVHGQPLTGCITKQSSPPARAESIRNVFLDSKAGSESDVTRMSSRNPINNGDLMPDSHPPGLSRPCMGGFRRPTITSKCVGALQFSSSD